MAKLEWDKIGERLYEIGVSHAVLFPFSAGAYTEGVAWSGFTGITESPTGAEPTKVYADNIPYLTLLSAEEMGGTLEALYSPEEFDSCDGTVQVAKGVRIKQQTRQTFGLSYKSLIGNDTEGTDYGYKLHIWYGCIASPSEKSRATTNESPTAEPLSWEVTTTPVAVTGYKPTAAVEISSIDVDPVKLAELETILYGGVDGEGTDVPSRLPTIDEIITLMGPVIAG